jgi:hypothetical protein
MYLILFIIIIIMLGYLFLRRERLTLDELNKQLENSEPTLLPQYTRLQYEQKIVNSEADAKPILETLQKSEGMETIKQKRVPDYVIKLEEANKNLTDFEEKYKDQIIDVTYTTKVWGTTLKRIRKGLKDPVLDAKFIELKDRIKNINAKLNEPLTIDEGILIEEPQILEDIRTKLNQFGFSSSGLNEDQLKEIAENFGIDTSSKLQKIKDSLKDIKELLRKDDELRKKMEQQYKAEDEERKRKDEQARREFEERRSSRESVTSRLRRERREKTAARKKAQAEAEAEAKAKTQTQAQAITKAQTQAQAIARAQTQTQTQAQAIARAQTQTQTQAQAIARAQGQAQAIARAQTQAQEQAQERISQEAEEIEKIQEIRKEAEEAMNQLREIPLEERIKRKIFVQPKMVHKPYPFVRSTPANPPYDTTKYEKRQNLFKTSEISSIFPRPII